MKSFVTFAIAAMFGAVLITPVYAQQPKTDADPHHPAPGASTAPAPPAAATKPEGMPMMMDMCRRMMGEGMAMPMMGGPAHADPKAHAHMLEMRGEMMKAMGEIMMKHGRRMQGMKTK